MLKNTNTLSDLLNFETQKKSFDTTINTVLKVIKKESGVELERENIFIKNNSLKIKASSNDRFVILLHIKRVREGLNSIGGNFILEL